MSETKISAILTVEGLRKFQSDLNVAADTVEATGKRGTIAGRAMSTGMKAGFLAAGAAAVVSVKKFASFDDALNRVKINSGASEKQMVKLEKAARKMGERFPASGTEVAEAMNEILKAGMSVEDMLSGGLENALAMATAEGLDMATSATAMSQAMAVFAVEGKNANTVTAALSNVASGTSANINDLTSSLAQVGGTAAQAGMSVGDTSAALGVLIQNGLDGSKAGTALNSMLLALRAPTDKAAKALKQAGVEVYDASGKMKPFREVLGNLSKSLRGMSSDQERAAFLQKTFGVDAQQAASILSKQIPLYDKLATSTRNVDAPVQKAREQMRSFAMQLDTTGESLGNMAVQVGAALAPAIASVLPGVQSVAAAIGGLPPGMLQAGAAFIALTGAFYAAAPAIVATVTALRGLSGAIAVQAALSGATGAMALFSGGLGAATMGVRALTVAMLANPLFLAATAAAGIVAVVAALNQIPASGATAALQNQRAAADVLAASYGTLKAAVDGVVTAQLSLEGSSLAVKRAALTHAQAMDRVAQLEKDGKRGTDEYKSALLSQQEAWHSLKTAKERAAQADQALKDSQKELATQARDVADALKTSSDTYASSSKELKKYADISLSVGDGQRKSVAELAKTTDGLRILANSSSIAGSKVGKYATAMLESGDAMREASSKAGKIEADLGRVGGKAGAASGEIADMRGALSSLPPSKMVTLTLNTSGFSASISYARGAIDALQNRVSAATSGRVVPAAATGGRVYGPGTGKSDSVPAMLSAGEWVLTAKQARAIGYGTLASIPKFAQGGAWFNSQASAARASSATGSAHWKTMERAGATPGYDDDRTALLRQAEALRARLATVKGQQPAGSGDAKKANAQARNAAITDIQSMLSDITARVWQIDNIEAPAAAAARRQEQAAQEQAGAQSAAAAARSEAEQAAADAQRDQAAALQASIQGVGAKGSDLWKQSSLAGVTESLDDDLAVLQAQLAQLQALGTPEAAGRITDTLADIWTMQNITMPAKAAAQQAQQDAWRNEAAMALGRGFYSASGGAGGGGSMGITDTSGGDAGGVGHAPRPEIDRVWLAGVQLNDLDARTGAGCEVTTILGWDEAEDFESTRSKRADGDALGGTRDGSVRLVVRGRLRGSTYQDYHERRRALKAMVRAAVDQTTLKVPDVTHGDDAGDYPSTYSDAMAGMERRIVRLVSNLKWGDSYGTFGAEFEFELRSPHRFVEADVPASAPSGSNAAAMTASAAARTSILAIRGEVAAAPAMSSSLKFYGTSVESVLAVRAGASAAALDTFTKLTNPATLPANQGTGAAFDPSGAYLAITHAGSPYITIYKRSGDTFTKLTNPSSLPPLDGTGAAFDPSGTYLAISHLTTPYVTIYKRSGDVFTKLANPADLPAGQGRAAAFDPSGTYLAIAHTTSPYVTIYKRSGDVFTKLANPADLPAGAGYGASFDPSGTYLAIAHDTTPYVTIYKRSGDVFTKLANPADLPANQGTGAAFDPSGAYLAITHFTTPFVTIYKRSGDVFTKLTNPATLPASTALGASFDPTGTYLSVAHATTPFVTIYKRSGDVFTKLTNPATLPASNGAGAAFEPSGAYLAIPHDTTPFVTIYAVAGSEASYDALGTLTVNPPGLAISARADVLPVASADITSSQPLTSQDSFDIDTIAGTATPVHRTPLARLIGGASFVAGIIPSRYAGGPTTMLEIVTRSAAAGAAIAALAAFTQSDTDVVNSTAGGEDDYIGVLGALTATPAQVATGMPGWRAKRSAANFTASSYARRRIDAILGQPKSRPVIHCMLVKPAASYATATTDLNAFGSGVAKFAHLLTLDVRSGGINYINAVGFFHNGTRMQPTCVRYDDQGTDGYRLTYASGALSITPDPASHVWVAAIIDAGSNVWNAIVLVDVNTGEPLMWFVEGHDMFDGNATEITGSASSQAMTATTSGTRASNVAYPTAAERYLGCGSNTAGWAASVAGTTVPAGGMGAIITLDAAAELFDHGITSAAMLVDADSATDYAAISSSIVEWVRARFAPQSIRRDPIALEVEWTDRVPDLHGEPIVRLDSVPASTTEQALGASRTGGLSTEQMTTAAAGGAGESVIEAREVR